MHTQLVSTLEIVIGCPDESLQVPLLLELGEDERALDKALESGDSGAWAAWRGVLWRGMSRAAWRGVWWWVGGAGSGARAGWRG